MTRALKVAWPDPRAFADRRGDPIRLLAVSDDRDPALDHPENRDSLSPIDLVVGCGDLEPDYLSFLADAFVAPLLFVRGNHDAGAAWHAESVHVPQPLADGSVLRQGGLAVAGLSWPSLRNGRARDETGAWSQVARLMIRHAGRPPEPLLVVSHAPPRGAGDVASDPYHLGFGAYEWLARRVKPPLWLHGHTPVAASGPWHCSIGRTTFVNVTGAVLVELTPMAPGSRVESQSSARSTKSGA